MFLAVLLEMASIWKHPESKFWFACFTTAEGKRTKRTTRTSDRKLAEKLAAQYEEAANKKKTALNTRRVIQELHASITGEDLVFPTIRQHFETWLESKQGGEVAPATLVFYQGATKKFITWLGARADNDLATLGQDDITAFRNHASKTLSAKSVNHELKTLKMIFRDALHRKLITDDPALAVKTLKDKAPVKKRVFTDQQIQTILKNCDEEWRSMVLFGLYTGQRLIDIASLRRSNVNLEKGIIELTARKTSRMMSIPIAPALRKHVDSMTLGADGLSPLHPRAFEIVNKQGKSGHLSNQFAAILAKAGLREKKAHRRTGVGRGGKRDESGLSFHSLRHTAVTMLKEAGIPHAVVQELIGHDSESMSAHYTHVGNEALKKAANALPDVTSP
jgi:site-specific recombinase XerD